MQLSSKLVGYGSAVSCALLFLTLHIHLLSTILPFHSFFLFWVGCVLCEAEKGTGCNSSIFTAPEKEGNHFSLLAIRLKDRNFKCTYTSTHTHTYTLTGTHKHVYKKHTQIPVDPEVEVLCHYCSFREMNTSSPTPLQRLLISLPCRGVCVCLCTCCFSVSEHIASFRYE